MSGPNGHAEANDSSVSNPPTAAPNMPSTSPFTPEKVKEFVAALEFPFDPSQIEWRVMNTTKNGQPMRGQVVPYADQRAYDELAPEPLNSFVQFSCEVGICEGEIIDLVKADVHMTQKADE